MTLAPAHQHDGITVYHAEILDGLKALADNSIDTVVTDPPYGLEFMGEDWDAPWKHDGDVLDDPAAAGGFQAAVAEVIPNAATSWKMDGTTAYRDRIRKEPNSDAARRWQGWGTALKPAFEPVVMARNPLDGTVARNVQAHDVGALNIDDCRTGEPDSDEDARWPANALLDPAAAAELDRQTGGNATQFFPTFRYQAKAPTHERPNVDGVTHPTVKPLELMRWLIRLTSRPGAVVLDPFAGSGTTAAAARLENRDCITIERDPRYIPLILSRLHEPAETPLFDVV